MGELRNVGADERVCFVVVAVQYRWDDFVLDLEAYRLERAGVHVPLEPKAFNLLALLVGKAGRLFTKQEIFDALWPATAVTDHALTRVVAQLRKALGDEAREARYLETVPTRGYRWIRPLDPDTVHTPAILPVAVPEPVARPVTRPGHVVYAAIGLLVVATGVGLWTIWPDPPTAPRAAARPVQLTTHAGLDLHPAYSPAGDAIAFASDRSGGFEIYVRALGGSATDVALTSDGAQNVQPAWSPDGRFIVYHSYRDGGLWVIPARGGTPRQIAPQGSKPDWSPDGRRIAFQSDQHADVAPTGFGAQAGSTLLVVNADGSGPAALTKAGEPLGGHAAPSWSPDGRHIAFTVFDSGHQNGLWMLDVASGRATQLQQGQDLFETAFADDGSALYVAGGEALVIRIPLDRESALAAGPSETLAIAGVPGVRGLSVSPDGRALTFAGVAFSGQIWVQPVDAAGAPTLPAHALTNDTSRRNSLPVVSPDGLRVAYVSKRTGVAADVWMINADGSQPVQLTAGDGPESQPQWMPDGHRVAYQANRGDAAGLWAVDIATRREAPLFDASRLRGRAARRPAGQMGEFALAPSMTQAALTMLLPPLANRVLYLSPFPDFAPVRLSDPGLSVGYPAWAPDERAVAVEIKEGASTHAGVIDLPGGRLRQLTNERGQTWVRSWSPDGTRIAAAVLREGAWSLRWIDATTGEQATITPPSPPRVYVRYPAWSPKGAVYFERAEMLGNIWTLAISGS